VKTKFSLWLSSFILIALLGFNATFHVVEEGTLALQQRFGELIQVHREPGLMFKWPWPIDQIQTLELRRHLFNSKEEQVLTRDQNSLVVANHVIWSIHPDHGERFKIRLQNIDNFEAQLESRLRSLRNGMLGAKDFSTLFSGKGTIGPLEDQLKTSLASSCLEDFGVEIHDVGFTHLGLAPAVLESVYAKMNAERQRIASRLRGEGEAEAASITAEAQAKFDEEMAKVQGEVQRILGEAEASSIEAFKTLAEHKDLALKLKKLESLEALLKGRSTIVLDRNTPPLDLLRSSPRE
jgi:membrane protease subunit HflC